jgi:hypothetical protein
MDEDQNWMYSLVLERREKRSTSCLVMAITTMDNRHAMGGYLCVGLEQTMEAQDVRRYTSSSCQLFFTHNCQQRWLGNRSLCVAVRIVSHLHQLGGLRR